MRTLTKALVFTLLATLGVACTWAMTIDITWGLAACAAYFVAGVVVMAHLDVIVEGVQRRRRFAAIRTLMEN